MVLIHFKKTENNQFLYETPASAQTNDLISELVFGTLHIPISYNMKLNKVNNTRVVIDRLSQFIEDLATFGLIFPYFSSLLPQFFKVLPNQRSFEV